MTPRLVTGASGYVGSRLVARLSSAGHDVIATGRDLEKLHAFDWPADVRRLELDVDDPRSIREAFESLPPVDVAYFLVHSIGEGDFARQDLESAQAFAAEAQRAGVRRIVYLGGFVPQAEDLSEHLESRSAVGEALGDVDVELVWLRAAIILGAGSTSFEVIRNVAERLPIIPLPTWMNAAVAPIAIDDVLYYLESAGDPTLPVGSYDIHTGEQPTYVELLKAYAAHRGLRRLWLPLPLVPPRLVAAVAPLLVPLPHELTADLIMSLTNTMSSSDDRIRDLVPDPPGGLTTIAEALARAEPQDGPPPGVTHSPDALSLTKTDPDWAGS